MTCTLPVRANNAPNNPVLTLPQEPVYPPCLTAVLFSARTDPFSR